MKLCIVGNSSELLSRHDGAFIDSCDRIIRLNAFRIRGFQTHVGSRIDVVSICLAPAVVEQNLSKAAAEISRAAEIWTPSWRGHAEPHEEARAMQTVRRDPRDLVFSDDTGHGDLMKTWYADFRVECLRRGGVKTVAAQGMSCLPTTGFLTIQLARARFPSATIYITGFGLTQPLNLDKFDASGVPLWAGHDIPTERTLLLADIQAGRCHQPPPAPDPLAFFPPHDARPYSHVTR